MASTIPVYSQEAHSKKLALFQTPPSDVGVEGIQYVDFRPSAQSSAGDCLEIAVFNTSNSYLDLQGIKLH